MMTDRRALYERVGAWALLGLLWGAALRAWMVLLALDVGERPHITFAGTYGGVLLPSALLGGLLGAAAHDAERGGMGWRRALLSPLLLMIAPIFVTKDFIKTLVTTGLGSGAIGVGLIGVLGGYAFSGLGGRRVRWLRGGLLVLLGSVPLLPVLLDKSAAAAEARAGKLLLGLLFALLMAALVTAVSAPARLYFKQMGPDRSR